MAYAQPRSCRTELRVGMTDGKYKRANINWSNASDVTAQIRAQMSGAWHGFNDVQEKFTPGGVEFSDPYYCDVAPIDEENI